MSCRIIRKRNAVWNGLISLPTITSEWTERRIHIRKDREAVKGNMIPLEVLSCEIGQLLKRTGKLESILTDAINSSREKSRYG